MRDSESESKVPRDTTPADESGAHIQGVREEA
jgi:hypothetical protein